MTLYRFAPSLALALLDAKVHKLVDPTADLFGPYTSTPKAAAGSVSKEERPAGEAFPTVARALQREGLDCVDGPSEDLQLGKLARRWKCTVELTRR